MSGRTAEPLHVLCVSPDGSVAAGVAAMLASMPDFLFATQTAGYADAPGPVSDLDLAIVVLDERPAVGLEVIERIHRSSGGEVHLVVVAPDDDPDLVVRAVRAGADEHLTLPLSQHDLFKVCTKVAEAIRTAPRESRSGTLWTVYGPKGGVGATTLAVNLAVALSAARRDVALVDLDVYAGDAALFLDVHPMVTLADVVARYDRLDGVFVQGAMTRHRSGVSILAAPSIGRGQVPVEPRAEQAIGVLELVTAMHELTLVNTPGIPSEATRAVLLAADRVLLVTDLTIPGLRACAATIDWLVGEGVDPVETIEVVVNRHDARTSEVSVAEVSRRMQAPVRAVLPLDDAAASSAVNSGRPLAEGTALHRAIAELAAPGTVPADGGLIQGLKRLFSGRAA